MKALFCKAFSNTRSQKQYLYSINKMGDNKNIDIIQNGVYDRTWLCELDKIPQDPQVLENSFAALMKADKANLSIEDMHNLFHKHAFLFVNHKEPIEPKIVSNIWRARKDVDELTEDLSNPKTFSYPPFCTYGA